MVTNKHIYVPIGWDCNTARQLEREGKRKVAYPFDWTMNTYDSICIILDKGFSNFLTNFKIGPQTYTQFYETTGTKSKPLKNVYDYDLQTVIGHDYYDGVDLQTIRDKYQKRYLRLISDIKSADKITLVGSIPTEKFFNKGMEVYEARLDLNLRDLLTHEKTIEDVANKVRLLNPNAVIKTEEHSVNKMLR